MKITFPCILNRASKQSKGLLFCGAGLSGSYNLTDLTGNGHELNLQLGTIPALGRWAAGVDGGKSAITFDGSTNAAGLRNTTTIPLTNALTCSMWIKTTKTGYGYLMVKWGVAGGSDAFHLRVDASTGFIYWSISTNGSYQSANDLNGTSNVADGKWHLIVATYDGTTSSVYVDGKLEASKAVSGNIAAAAFSSVFIGGLSDLSNTGNNFLGTLEDPRLYNTCVSAKIIKEMYAPATRWQVRRHLGRKNYFKPANIIHNIAIDETLVLAETIVRGASLKKNVNETLIFDEDVFGSLSAIVVNINETLTLSETIVRGASKLMGVSETLIITITGSIRTPKTFNNLIINPFVLFETLQKYPIFVRNITETLTLVEEAKVRLPQVFDLNITETLSLIQALPKNRTVVKNVTEAITITETKTAGALKIYLTLENLFLDERASGIVAKIRFNTEVLTLVETLTFKRIRNRNISEHLNLVETFNRQNVYVRNISEVLPLRNGMNLPIKVGGITIHVDPVQVIKVPKKCYVTLDCAETSTALTLPCPQMGDSEKNLHQQVIKRSMNGKLYTYIRKNDLQELKYTFLLGRPLCLALQNFCYTNIDRVLTLTNWKGEIWKVYITNNPIEFTSKGLFEGEGEAWEIPLEFQGIKILG